MDEQRAFEPADRLLTSENDVHEVATVDETRSVEDLIVLRLFSLFTLFIGTKGLLVFAALVDIEDLLSNVLSKPSVSSCSSMIVARVHTLWFLLNKTRSAQLAGGI